MSNIHYRIFDFLRQINHVFPSTRIVKFAIFASLSKLNLNNNAAI